MSALRLPYDTLSPKAYQGLLQTKLALDHSSLGKELIELVNLRISQINGCSYCLEMHAASLRSSGMSNTKSDCLAGWRVSEHFDERERAALDVDRISRGRRSHPCPRRALRAFKSPFQ